MKFLPACLFLLTLNAGAQVSRSIDSTALPIIASLQSTASAYLTPLYNYAVGSGLQKRLDTLPYDHSFVSAESVDSAFSIIEWYFTADEDSIPSMIFVDGSPADGDPEYEIALQQLQKEYAELRPLQTAPYKRKQVYWHGCVKPTRKHAKEEMIETLKRTYRVQIHVDRGKKLSNVSVQTPPARPRITVERKGGKF